MTEISFRTLHSLCWAPWPHKRGPAPSEHARTHADLSAASPRAAGPAPSCREAPEAGGKARDGRRLGGVAWGLKPRVRLPPGCDLAAKPLLECGHPSHGSCDAAAHPRASRVGGRKPRCFCPAPARGPERLVPPIPQRFGLPRRQAWSRPSPTASRARGTLRGFQGDSNFALQQRTAAVHEEKRQGQRGPP